MVHSEIKSVLHGLSASQKDYGLSYEDFSNLMYYYKYASKEHHELLFNIFHMVTGNVKPIHRIPPEAISRMDIAMMPV